jgi:hypothetical protein
VEHVYLHVCMLVVLLKHNLLYLFMKKFVVFASLVTRQFIVDYFHLFDLVDSIFLCVCCLSRRRAL